MFRKVLVGCLALLEWSCLERKEPPGATPEPSAAPALVRAPSTSETGAVVLSNGEVRTLKGESPSQEILGTEQDNLPFEPDGTRLASIAWRTWVYTDTGPKRTRHGYLRAGSVVDARSPAIVNSGCEGGWYRVNPRGFVCVGKGATKDLTHPVVVHHSVLPVRGQGFPYLYAMAGEVAPFRYFRLPSTVEMETIEGKGVSARVIPWKQRLVQQGVVELLGEVGPPPEFLSTKRKITKAYGVPQQLHYSVHAGRAAPDSGFAIQRVFQHESRYFGLTTEADLIALDRTRIVKPSQFHGVELGDDEDLPVAFIQTHVAQRYLIEGDLPVRPNGTLRHRQAIKLTGNTKRGFLETRDGDYIANDAIRLLSRRENFPSFAAGKRKWLDLSIRDQAIVAYVGKKAVYATLVSTGRGGLADPEKSHATARGTFMVHSKHVSATMDGSDDKSDSYNLLDVPFVQYFHKGYALHGTYWHDEFGKERSHGCVNLSPIDSAWIFEWTDPAVPEGWHSVLNKDRGTVVFVRP